MTIYQLGDTVTLTWATPPNTATVVLYVTAPDGTTQSAPATSYVGAAWQASLTGNQYGEWLFTWVSSGTYTGRSQGTFQVGGPWYSKLVTLRNRINRADFSADDQLADALTSARRLVEQHCDNRTFFLDSVTSQRTYPTRGRLCLSQGYVLKVDDIGDPTIVAEVGNGTNWTTLTDIEIYPVNSTAKGRAITGLTSQTDWQFYRLARITAKWGWPSVPDSVAQANLLAAHRLYFRKNTPQGIAGGGEGGMMRLADIDPDAAKLLYEFTAQFLAA